MKEKIVKMLKEFEISCVLLQIKFIYSVNRFLNIFSLFNSFIKNLLKRVFKILFKIFDLQDVN